ncbi:MAG: DoxX family protein [Ferruginibacter sp.]|nr:DoxX family protein [Chitinophagaceae bacterium]
MKILFRQFMFGTSIGNDKVINIGWLLFRIHAGLSIAIHAGWPKMNSLAAPGWFAEQVAGLGFTFPSPEFWAGMAAWGEFIGGILLAIGLFTRFAAIQLAFQFFVIAFLWYDQPEPLTGMYFQQLLFWVFILISFGGGGRYSLDNLIVKSIKIKAVPVFKTAMVSALLCLGMNNYAQSPALSINDFKPLEGNWKGTLTYKDYSSNKSQTIEALTVIKIRNKNSFVISIDFPNEPGRGGKDKYIIAKNGMTINKKKVIERTSQPDGSLKIVLEEKGEDGNDHKPATFHHIFLIEGDKLTLTKMVNFDAESNFFQRNQYVFSRN